MTTTINDAPELSGKNTVRSLFFNGVCSDSSKTTIFQKKSQQEFVRDDVLVNQSIDPYQRIADASKIINSGESLFFNEKTANKKKCGESLFLRKLVLGIPAQASGKNLTRPLMPSAPQTSCVRATSPLSS